MNELIRKMMIEARTNINACVENGIYRVDEKNNRQDGLLVLPVKIETDFVYRHFMIDCGAQKSSMRKSLYDRLCLNKPIVEELEIHGVTGETYISNVYNINFQGFNGRNPGVDFNIDMDILDVDNFSILENEHPIEGLLGIDFLQKYGFNIDFEKKVLSCKCS